MLACKRVNFLYLTAKNRRAMARKDKTSSKKKDKYRIRNWKQYNRSLVNRGSITFWFSKEVTDSWYSSTKTGKRGRSNKYSDDAIRSGLMMKAVFKIPLRMLQGFIASLITALGIDLEVPHYSVFCRRAKGLQIPMSKFLKPGEKLNIIFDSTGVKVFGEGEWKVRKHGYSKRRTWRKIHIGMCADSGQVVVSAMSSNNVSDEEAMVQMMDALEGIPLGNVFGDGAYDTIDCYEVIHELGGNPIIPPDKNARVQKKKPLPSLEKRDEAIRRIHELGEEEGRTLWKQEVGYHKRSVVETHMFRHKTILGDRLSARKGWSQAAEVTIKCHVLNRMTALGMPDSHRVAS